MVKASNNQNKERKSGLVFAQGLEAIYKKKSQIFTMLQGASNSDQTDSSELPLI